MVGDAALTEPKMSEFVQEPPRAKPAEHADGIYLGLRDQDYFKDPALGSGDMRTLLWSAPAYWYKSPYNPMPPEENDDTPSRIRGRAIHAMVLEGDEAFSTRYRRAPHDDGMTSGEKSAATKALKKRLAEQGIAADILPGADYDRAVIASAMITKHPELSQAFRDGIPEVSIFWTRDGVRRKARIDYLKLGGLGDLKSITNIKKIEFERACIESIANYRYEIQAAHYLEARAMVPKLVAKGSVFSDHGSRPLKWLEALADTKKFAFQWVFFAASGPPETFSKIVSPANPMVEHAKGEIERATATYLDFVERFGLDQMWLSLQKPTELFIEEMPGWWARR
jgi:hypothetical protein